MSIMRLTFQSHLDGVRVLSGPDLVAHLSDDDVRHLVVALLSKEGEREFTVELSAPEPTPLTPKPGPRPAHGTPAPPLPAEGSSAVREAPASCSFETGSMFEIPDLTLESLRFTRSARDFADKLGVSDQQVVDTWENPDDEWASADGMATVSVRGDVAITVAHDNGCVLAVSTAERAYRLRPEDSTPPVPRGKGGSGRRYPSTIDDFYSDLRSRGYEVEVRNAGHVGVTSPWGLTFTGAATPSDHRTLMNTIKRMEAFFGTSFARDSR